MDRLDQYGVRLSLLWEPTDDLVDDSARGDVGVLGHGARNRSRRPGRLGVGGGLYDLFNAIDPVANPRPTTFRPA